MTVDTIALEVLRTLTRRVRFLTTDYASELWLHDHPNPRHAAAEVLANLKKQQLLERETIEVRTARPAEKPLFAWSPGDRAPTTDTWRRLCRVLESRWSAELVPVSVYFASPRASNLFGTTSSGIGRPCEWSHDLRITEVYLRYRRKWPKLAERWKGEAAQPKWGKRIARMKDPDAFLVDRSGSICRVIEVAGKYSPSHLSDLHHHCNGVAFDRVESWSSALNSQFINNPYNQIEIGYELW